METWDVHYTPGICYGKEAIKRGKAERKEGGSNF